MLSKYYSLDECYDRNVVLDHLEELQNEEMIVFEVIDSEIVKIKDISLSEKQTKELIIKKTWLHSMRQIFRFFSYFFI